MNIFYSNRLIYKNLDSPGESGEKPGGEIGLDEVKKFFKGVRDKLVEEAERNDRYNAEIDKQVDELNFSLEKKGIWEAIGPVNEKTLRNKMVFGFDVPKVDDVVGRVYKWKAVGENGSEEEEILYADEVKTQYTLVEMAVAAFAEGGKEGAEKFASMVAAVSNKDRGVLTDDGFKYEYIVTELVPMIVDEDSVCGEFRPVINEVLNLQKKYLEDIEDKFKYMMNGYVYGCLMMANRSEADGGLPRGLQAEYKDFVMREYERVIYVYSKILNLWSFKHRRNEIIEHLHKLVLPPSKWLEVRGKARKNLGLDK